MAAHGTILVAGAGIAGLTCALALARRGFRVVILEAARELSEIGAALQLSPNATRVLAGLGLAEALRPHATAPDALCVNSGRTGQTIVSIPLGPRAEARHGSPYWLMLRADLQRILLEAVRAEPAIVIRTGLGVHDVVPNPQGVIVAGRTQSGVMVQEPGRALVGADGLWSVVRRRLGHEDPPRFQGRAAWRALIDGTTVDPAWREPRTHLWLGPGAHLVHYPVRGGAAINLVAIVPEEVAEPGWSVERRREVLLDMLAGWAPSVHSLLSTAPWWRAWSLYDLKPKPRPGRGPVTLVGDAAHAMLPFLAQGAAMAIEDAAVLADCAAAAPDDLAAAFRAYERAREARTRAIAKESARAGQVYHLGLLAPVRNLAMRWLGGGHLAARQDWIYRWPA